jgi:arginyl-tRNA synthetase
VRGGAEIFAETLVGELALIRDHARHLVDEAQLDLLTHPTEGELIRRIGTYPETVAYAAEERAPHKVAHYIEDLAEAFHRFYTECTVIGDDPELTRARYWLCVATRQTVVNALGLLGVSAPDRM